MDGAESSARAEEAADSLKKAGYSDIRIRKARQPFDSSRIITRKEHLKQAKEIASILGLENQVQDKADLKSAAMVVLIGKDWISKKAAPVPEPSSSAAASPQTRTAGSDRASAIGSGFAFVPFGSINRNRLGKTSRLDQEMDVGAELFVERRWLRSLSAGVSAGGLMGLHATSRDSLDDTPDTTLGEPVNVGPYVRYHIPLPLRGKLRRSFDLHARVGAGFAAFRSATTNDSNSIGYSGRVGLGGARLWRHWQAGVEVSYGAMRFHPSTAEDWLTHFPSVSASVARRF